MKKSFEDKLTGVTKIRSVVSKNFKATLKTATEM